MIQPVGRRHSSTAALPGLSPPPTRAIVAPAAARKIPKVHRDTGCDPGHRACRLSVALHRRFRPGQATHCDSRTSINATNALYGWWCRRPWDDAQLEVVPICPWHTALALAQLLAPAQLLCVAAAIYRVSGGAAIPSAYDMAGHEGGFRLSCGIFRSGATCGAVLRAYPQIYPVRLSRDAAHH